MFDYKSFDGLPKKRSVVKTGLYESYSYRTLIFLKTCPVVYLYITNCVYDYDLQSTFFKPDKN